MAVTQQIGTSAVLCALYIHCSTDSEVFPQNFGNTCWLENIPVASDC